MRIPMAKYWNIADWENANPYEDIEERTKEEIEEEIREKTEYCETMEIFREDYNE